MRGIVGWLLLIGLGLPALAQEPGMYYYQGSWSDPLSNGPMSAEIEKLDGDKWLAKFTGTWQGAPFSYQIRFSGPAAEVRGQEKINGAMYSWAAKITPDQFVGRYRSNRSGEGTWTMARQPVGKAAN